MKYRMMALGANFANGLVTSFPNLATGSLPDFTWRSFETNVVWLRLSKVESNVSISASSMRKFLLKTENIVGFAEYEQNGGEDCEWSVEEGEKCNLGNVGDGEHQHSDTETE